MKEIKVKDIVRVCNGELLFGDADIVCEDFSKDTRQIKLGDVYIGIKGENFDGNEFYNQALKAGAKVCLLDRNCTNKDILKKYDDIAIVLVKDSIEAIQKLAQYKRSLYNIPIIAITGSVGKTSTKDIVASVLNQKYYTLKTQGNLNNHIGLPLTILGLKEHEAAVIEMGMNNFGEIRTLTNIAHPTMCVITNIGTSHIGNLGSRENILKAKLEILEGMTQNGVVVVNNDNDLLHKWAEQNKQKNHIVTYGIYNESDFMAKQIKIEKDKSSYEIEINGKIHKIIVPIAGEHFIYNSLCAISIGLNNEIAIEKVKQGIKNFELTKNRMELIETKNEITIINDVYNASFDSMKASLKYLGTFKNRRKVAILGDMLELGEFSKTLHEKVGEEVVQNNINLLITGGKEAKHIARVAKKKNSHLEVKECDTTDEILEVVENLVKAKDIVLIKASNGMKFIKITEKLKK